MEQGRQPAIAVDPSRVGPDASTGIMPVPMGAGQTYQQPAPPACPRCNTPAPFGASFCAHCGAVLVPATPAIPVPPGSYALPGQEPYAGYPNAGYAPAPPAGWHAPAPGMTVALPSVLGGAAVVPYAGFWLRFAAWLLDLFGLAVIYFAAAIALMIVLGAGQGTMDETAQTRVLLTRVLLIVGVRARIPRRGGRE